MRTKIIISVLSFIILLWLAGCASATQNQPDSKLNLANPAAVYCEDQGGEVDIRTTDEVAVGYCVFPDNSECEEWAFFRGECTPGDTLVGMPNPAAVYCEDQGGESEIRTNADGSQDGFCIFDDGSECEQWAFLRGECKPGE